MCVYTYTYTYYVYIYIYTVYIICPASAQNIFCSDASLHLLNLDCEQGALLQALSLRQIQGGNRHTGEASHSSTAIPTGSTYAVCTSWKTRCKSSNKSLTYVHTGFLPFSSRVHVTGLCLCTVQVRLLCVRIQECVCVCARVSLK